MITGKITDKLTGKRHDDRQLTRHKDYDYQVDRRGENRCIASKTIDEW